MNEREREREWMKNWIRIGIGLIAFKNKIFCKFYKMDQKFVGEVLKYF